MRKFPTMTCCAGYPFVSGGERTFEVAASRIRYGSGSLQEVGSAAIELGMRHVALITDAVVARLPYVDTVVTSLRRAGCSVELYDETAVEPTDYSFERASDFARGGAFDGFVSVGGGSSIDTAKAANLYATYPAEFDTYVNAPIGRGVAVPGPLRPHIACPTTAGTGAEVTGIAIFDYVRHHAKTGIASRRLRPTFGIIDPDVTATLPKMVAACSAFDVLAHALESYTARPYTRRERPATPAERPPSQGANPFSDLACLEALGIIGAYLERAIADSRDMEARERMMFAATLAGIGFGNAGVHVPHAMSYAVAGLVSGYRAPDYPGVGAMVPHGMAVATNLPSVVRYTAQASPERHLRAAALLGADVRTASAADAGEILAQRLEALMRATAMPNGIGAVGFESGDIGALRSSTLPQQRLLANAPLSIGSSELDRLFENALRYW